MEYCASCGQALLDHALFCGHCGHLVQPTKDAPTHITAQPAGSALLDNGPTAISASSWSAQHSDENLTAISSSGPTAFINGQDLLYRDTWSPGAPSQPDSSAAQGTEEQEEQEERRRRALLLGLPLLGALADAHPSVNSVPIAPGTPQIGGGPMVQGTPSAPIGPSVAQGLPKNLSVPSAPIAAQYSPPYTTAWPKLSDTPHPAFHHSGTLPSSTPHAPKPPSPSTPPSPTPTPTPHPLPPGCALILFILGIILLIIFASLGTFVTFFPPAISLVGSSNVVPGAILHLHGRNFAPGISVTLTLDDTLQVFAPAKTPTYTAYNLAPTSATALPLIASSHAPIPASATGTFDVSLPVSASWSIGPHMLRATEAFSSRSALLNFTIGAISTQTATPTPIYTPTPTATNTPTPTNTPAATPTPTATATPAPTNTPTPTPNATATPTPTNTPTPSPTPSPTASPTPTPSPTLVVTPNSFGPRSCPNNICTVILTEGSGSQGTLNWSTGDQYGKAQFNPSSGTLSASNNYTAMVTIIPPTCTDVFYFFYGQGNRIDVPFQCG